MQLSKVKVTNFRSVDDSTEFHLSRVTCLVGKNESGKTTLLQALERLNPQDGRPKEYDGLLDYPRRHWSDFEERHPDGKAAVVDSTWTLEDGDMAALAEKLGPNCLISREVKVGTGFNYESADWVLNVDEPKVVSHLVESSRIEGEPREALKGFGSVADLHVHLQGIEARDEAHEELFKNVSALADLGVERHAIRILQARMPKFMYVSQYTRMNGKVSIEKLVKDIGTNNVGEQDDVFLAFLKYAGTSLEDLKDVNRYEDLRARVEAASSKITDRIFEYWSQNQHLEVSFTLEAGKPGDPPPFNNGNVMHTRIKNNLHKATVAFDNRSAGFVWFFSFLVMFSQVRKQHGNVIILLDEPGHGLHGKAQADLLRYIEEKLKPQHQVIYTTHSPFMVPADRLETVRLVEDVVEYGQNGKAPKVLGTKVSEQFLSRDADSLFPLQAALGYEISQTLFVGKNTLLVEGPSDILYLQAVSEALKSRSRTGLDPRWTLCPAGGVDKMSSFASLFSGKGLHISVLTDMAKDVKKSVERLKTGGIVPADHVFTAADFTGTPEADVEDLFDPELFAEILNAAYGLAGEHALTAKKLLDADGSSGRAVVKAAAYFRLLPERYAEFDHFSPANWLISNRDCLEGDGKAKAATLDRFEKVFESLNALL
jgi:predicted ATPase